MTMHPPEQRSCMAYKPACPNVAKVQSTPLQFVTGPVTGLIKLMNTMKRIQKHDYHLSSPSQVRLEVNI